MGRSGQILLFMEIYELWGSVVELCKYTAWFAFPQGSQSQWTIHMHKMYIEGHVH